MITEDNIIPVLAISLPFLVAIIYALREPKKRQQVRHAKGANTEEVEELLEIAESLTQRVASLESIINEINHSTYKDTDNV